MEKTPSEILKQYWGYDGFRPMQEDIIWSILEGNDTLALLPTGGGKSICFQVPALLQDGICIVVSPLISLMKDQVDNLQKRSIAAKAIYSGMGYRQIDELLDNCIYGRTKLLYLSPERLKSELAIERISKMNVNLIAVDEAHCISQWGYDFRPSYLEINEIRKLHPEVPVVALTATATTDVVQDIQERLAFKKGKVYQNSFKRENLAYVVRKEENKEEKLLNILNKVPGTSVVYVRNRRKTKDISNFLNRNNINADFYHAGLNGDLRSKKQSSWIKSKTRVIVATNAFGMGIDKPDVRSVVHLDLPDNLEAYFQEAGRGGRDGKKSFAALLYSDSDKKMLTKHFETSFPELKEIKRVYQALGSYFQLALGGGIGKSYDFDLISFCTNFKLDILTALNSLKHLEKMGWISMTESVYMPSTVKMKISREDIYDFQLKNPKLEKFIKFLLRSNTGIFTDFVSIREGKLANSLKTETVKIVSVLELLDKEGIIIYRQKKDSPQLVFLRERVSIEDLNLDVKLYNFLKDRAKFRIEKAIEYCEKEECRSQLLLSYFGEKKSKKCGVCDVCLGRNKSLEKSDDFERLSKKILQLLKKENLTLPQIIDSFHAKDEKKIIGVIQYMVDEKIIKSVEEKFKLLDK